MPENLPIILIPTLAAVAVLLIVFGAATRPPKDGVQPPRVLLVRVRLHDSLPGPDGLPGRHHVRDRRPGGWIPGPRVLAGTEDPWPAVGHDPPAPRRSCTVGDRGGCWASR